MKHSKVTGHFKEYVREVANRMELRDWWLFLSHEPANEGCNAQIQCVRARKSATIRIAPDFHLWSREDQRQTIVHELVHCHFAPFFNVVYRILPKKARELFEEAVEYAVDPLADVIAKGMPLPPKFPKK